LKFKVDENLPTEYAPILREAGFEADTVSNEKLSGVGDSVLSERCRAEDRVLMTLDLDFANVQAYPPKSHGIWNTVHFCGPQPQPFSHVLSQIPPSFALGRAICRSYAC
jgi:predicted nuclease of predicted toxin-antitoxin system